ncbi:TPA: histidine kinase [Candidatus Sumerlaeota bacterium]|nr:histidine kinase [Candidatus Sumerlaeota bacterium]
MITTIKERCRVCYSCVRDCPARAIRIADGQAEVIPARCIGCGNCVRVCSQRAKRVLDGTGDVRDLLASGAPVVAIVAPSFPAEFVDVAPQVVAGMIRAMGFDYVVEAAFGADLVAWRYRRLMSENPETRYISTTCPAVIGFVERYLPQLIPHLAPVVSPMIATARALRKLHGPELKMVFIGPCIAKKGEAASEPVWDEINGVLTFREAREMMSASGITPHALSRDPERGRRHNVHDLAANDPLAMDFDPPHPGTGALFAISRGLVQAAGLTENLLSNDVVATDGRREFVEALNAFDKGSLQPRLLEVLCCEGCIMGAGMTSDDAMFQRRRHVSEYVRDRITEMDTDAWQDDLTGFEDLDLGRTFLPNDQRQQFPSMAELRAILERMGKRRVEDELNCGACGYETCAEHAIAIYKGRAENEMCLPYTIERLRHALKELGSAQEALVHSEKLANMGQLAAGIAHEVNNPIGIVLMYSHLLLETLPADSQQRADLEMIVEHAERCKTIVAGLLNFSRQNKITRKQTDVEELIGRLERAITLPPNVRLSVEHYLDDRFFNVDADQVLQVLVNLSNNAIGAMGVKTDGELSIATSGNGQEVVIEITDNGVGISEENLKHLFQPFFTTKEAGKGTGLGLAVSYGIIKMHRGDIRVKTNANPVKGPTGTTFRVVLPRIGDESLEPAV